MTPGEKRLYTILGLVLALSCLCFISIPWIDSAKWTYVSEIRPDIEANYYGIPSSILGIANVNIYDWSSYNYVLGGARIAKTSGKMQIRSLGYRGDLFLAFGWDDVTDFDRFILYLETIEEFQTAYDQWVEATELKAQQDRERAKALIGS